MGRSWIGRRMVDVKLSYVKQQFRVNDLKSEVVEVDGGATKLRCWVPWQQPERGVWSSGIADKPVLLASYKPEAVRFSLADNTQVRVYFAHNPVVWTGLPPELARNFARGRELPRGVSVDPLPPALLARLPAHPGFGYARVGADVALIDNATRVVVDMIEDVFD